MASALEMSASRTALSVTIRRIRNRWRLKLFLSGLAIVLGAALLALLVGPWLMEHFRFEPPVVTGVRIATYVVLALLAARYLVLPLARRVSDDQVALYLEEHDRSLEAVVLSAVESSTREAPASVRSPHLVARLLESAVARTRAIGGGSGIETRSVTFSLVALAAIFVTALLTLSWGPAFVRTGARLMAAPWRSAAEARPYFIMVDPGNAEVARGGGQVIRAQLHGFDATETELVVQRGADSAWKRLPMAAAGDSGAFQIRLFDLVARAAYYVESNGVRSPVYHLDVLNLPYVQQLDLEYHYPAYTGLANETIENGGDIAAPRGTSVIVHATTTMPVKGGRIVIEGKPAIPMALGADGTLTGAIAVTTNGFYKVELEMTTGRVVPGSLDYVIDVLGDTRPTIAFLKPGRDSRVTAVEEVYAEVQASDDYGLKSVDLRYSVNGGPERTVPLLARGSHRTEVDAGHTFFLEEFGLKPGDLVSYYARAVDNDSASGGAVAKTDIYFLTIRPFEQEYKQSQQGQQPGGGGGDQGGPGEFSRRQREIIAGTFKVDRDKARISAGDLRENFATLLLSQSRLRQQVQTLVQRLTARGIVQRDSSFRIIAEELPRAGTEMKAAEERLGTRRVHEALGPEQRALQHLQRAEAAYREIQVQFGGGGGGGGGDQPNAEDLADLFELQQDQLRNQYETESRGSQQAADQVVDETAEKLKQLAARQQRQTERLRSRAGASQSSSGGGNAQRQLADETEQAARQLERLSRQRPGDRELRESARRLRDAANAMRRAAASPNDAGAAQAASALQRLNEARRLLDENKQGRGARDAAGVANLAEQIASEQHALEQQLQRLGASGGAPGNAQAVRRLMDRKDTLANEIDELQSQLDRLSRESRRDQPEASRQLQGVADDIRRSRLSDQVRYSKGLARSSDSTYARTFEEQLTQQTDSLRRRVASAADALQSAGREQQAASRSLEQARDLVRGLESLEDRVRQARRLNGAGEQTGQQPAQGEGQGDSARGGGQAANPSRNGQAQGARQGQQGQQGQRGQAGRQGQGGQQGRPGQAQGGQQAQGAAGRHGGGAGGAPRAGGRGNARTGRGTTAGRLDPESIRQFSREYRERRQEAEALREALRQQGIETSDLDRAIQRMRALGVPGTYEDRAELERLQSSVTDRLKAFEFALRRQMGADDASRPMLGSNAQVPAQFKALVEEYYRSLSRTKKP